MIMSSGQNGSEKTIGTPRKNGYSKLSILELSFKCSGISHSMYIYVYIYRSQQILVSKSYPTTKITNGGKVVSGRLIENQHRAPTPV
jgi:hypothetical protein